MRKIRASFLWLAMGLLLLIGAAGLSLYNVNREAEAGKDANVAAEELTVVLKEKPQKAPVKSLPSVPSSQTVVIQPNVTDSEEPAAETMEPDEAEPVELDGRYYLGLITFPTLNRQLPVQDEWSYDNLRVSPCRMSGSVLSENLVIFAHNYRTHFGSLNRLSEGDEVSLMLTDGSVYVYQVSAKEIVEPTAVEDVAAGEWPLTLFTCTLGGQTRLVVRCDWAG